MVVKIETGKVLVALQKFQIMWKKKKKQMEMPHTKEYKQEISKSPLTLTLCDICLQEGIFDHGIILNPSFITKVSNSYVKQIIYNISHNWSHMEVYLKTTVFQNRVQTNSVTNYTSLTFSSLPNSDLIFQHSTSTFWSKTTTLWVHILSMQIYFLYILICNYLPEVPFLPGSNLYFLEYFN